MNVFFHESLQSSLPPSSLPQLAVSPLRKVLKICQEIQKTIEAIRQSILAVQQERPSSQRPFLRLESLPAIFPYAVDKPGRPDSVSRGVISASHIQTKCRSILIQIRCAILKITLIQLVSRLRFQSSPSTKPTESLSAEFLLPNKSSSDLPSLSPTIFHNLFDKPPSLESHENPDLASESVSSFPKQSSASPQELTALIQPLPPPSLLPKQTTGLTQELFIPRTMSAPFLRPSSQSSQTLTSSSLLKRASSISEELFGLAQKSSRGSSQKSSVSTLNSTPRNLSFATTTIPSRQTASLASSASSASSVSSTSPRLRHPSREENIPLSFSEETSPRQTNSSFEISHSSWPQKQQQQPLFSPQGVDLKENQQARSINSSPPLALDLQQAPNLSNSNSPQYKEKETLSSRLPYPNDDASFLHDQDQQIKHKSSVDDGATVFHLAHDEISNSKTESALSFISKSASQSIDAPSKFLPFTTGKMEMNSPRTRLNEQSPDQEASATGTSTRRVESIHPTNHLLLDINTQKIPLLFLFDKSSEYFFRMMRLRTSPKTCAKFDLIISNQYDYLSKENIQVRPFPNHSSSSRDFEMVIFLLNKTTFSFPYLMNGFQNQVYYESMTRFIRLKDLFPRARILFLLKTPTPLNTEASFSVLYDNSLFLDKIDSKTVEIICSQIAQPSFPRINTFFIDSNFERTFQLLNTSPIRNNQNRVIFISSPSSKESAAIQTIETDKQICQGFLLDFTTILTDHPLIDCLYLMLPISIEKHHTWHLVLSTHPITKDYYRKLLERGIAYFWFNFNPQNSTAYRSFIEWNGPEEFCNTLKERVEELNRMIRLDRPLEEIVDMFVGFR